MRPPFPGMDPWLENPELWPDVHNSLIVSIRQVLAPMVRPRYFVGVESRMTVLSAADQDQVYYPDVAIRTSDIKLPEHEGGVALQERVKADPFHIVISLPAGEIEEAFLTIKELPSRRLVTVIEVLSPTNKRATDAREEYFKKRRELLGSGVNLVEIDLLRAGKPMPPEKAKHSSDYRVLIFRPTQSRDAHLYGFSYKTAIPPIPVPLSAEDPEPTLDLNGILHDLYDQAGYDLAIDYRQPPQPRLRKDDHAWAESIIAQALGHPPRSDAGGDASS